MDHAEATATQATDRYLLGELTASEADGFEQHYFDCAECAEELRVGMRFMNGGRELAQEAAEPAPAKVTRIDDRRPRRSAWLPAAVAAALVIAVGAPMFLQQRGPAIAVASPVYLEGVQRAAADIPAVDRRGPVYLSIDVPGEPAYPRYEARLQRPGGAAILTEPITPARDGAPTVLHVARGLSEGLHELAIVGFDAAGRSHEVARSSFNVR